MPPPPTTSHDATASTLIDASSTRTETQTAPQPGVSIPALDQFKFVQQEATAATMTSSPNQDRFCAMQERPAPQATQTEPRDGDHAALSMLPPFSPVLPSNTAGRRRKRSRPQKLKVSAPILAAPTTNNALSPTVGGDTLSECDYFGISPSKRLKVSVPTHSQSVHGEEMNAVSNTQHFPIILQPPAAHDEAIEVSSASPDTNGLTVDLEKSVQKTRELPPPMTTAKAFDAYFERHSSPNRRAINLETNASTRSLALSNG